MDKNFDTISPQQMKQLLSSPAAQALAAMLQQKSETDMQNALEGAKSGDMAQVRKSLQGILNDPQTQALLRKLQEEQHG